MKVKRSHIIWESDDKQGARDIISKYVQLQISMFQRIVLITLRIGSLDLPAKIKETK